MIHPDTELRFMDPVRGSGVFATRDIPMGTITWVRDDLDQTFTHEQCAKLSPLLFAVIDQFSFLDRNGDQVLCWDAGRYVNHSCEASCFAPGYGFEIAVRDVAAGTELTNDYGSLNTNGTMSCRCGSTRCRNLILPGGPLEYAQWDALIAAAFALVPRVNQPLWELVREKDDIARVLAGKNPIPSCRDHAFDGRAHKLP